MSHEPTAENTMSPADSGRIFRPVPSASNPCIVCRYTGITKNSAAIAKYWTRNPDSPERSASMRNSRTFSSGIRPRSSRAR